MANQAQLEILKRGVEEWNQWRKENRDEEVDLSHADLSCLSLSKADLSKADLSNAILSKADLSNAKLSYVILSNAKLSNAKLSNAKLSNANLSNANLSDANLPNANLSNANLSNAILSDANLSNAKLSNAILSSAILSSAKLSNAILFSAKLSKANLSKANLSNAELFGADLSEANLSNAILSNSHLPSADLTGADLRRAVTSKDTLTAAQWRSVRFKPDDPFDGQTKPIADSSIPSSFPDLELDLPESLAGLDDVLIPLLKQALQEKLPELTLGAHRLERGNGKLVLKIVVESYQTPAGGLKELEKRIEEQKKEIEKKTRRILSDKETIERMQKDYDNLNARYCKLFTETFSHEQGIVTGIKKAAVLALDLKGSSGLEPENKKRLIGLLQSLAHALLQDGGQGLAMNTAGDSVVAAFLDPVQGLKCACMLSDNLFRLDIEHRIAMHFGTLDFSVNGLTLRQDMMGGTIDFVARLEPLAESWQLLVSDDLRDEIDYSDKLKLFHWTKTPVTLKKPADGHKAGDEVVCWDVRLDSNR